MAERLWPLIWLFAQRGGTSDLFFEWCGTRRRFLAITKKFLMNNDCLPRQARDKQISTMRNWRFFVVESVRVFRFVAVDDFTEMHLFKLAACCQRECEVMDR